MTTTNRPPAPLFYEVWVEERFVPCLHCCKHCDHNKRGRARRYAGRFYVLEAALAMVPEGRRLRITQWFERGHHGRRGARVVQFIVEFRSPAVKPPKRKSC